MNKEQVLQFIKENPEMVNEIITPEVVGNFLDGEQGKQYLQPKLDKYFSQGLTSWKANNLDKLVNEEVAKRFPNETPEMKRIMELEQKLANQEQERLRAEMVANANRIVGEKGLPLSIAKYLAGSTLEETQANIYTFEQEYKQHLDKSVLERTKGVTPPSTPTNNQKIDTNKMNFSQYAKAKEQGLI